MKRGWLVLLFVLAAAVATVVAQGRIPAQEKKPASEKPKPPPASEPEQPSEADEARERQAMERFLGVLEKNPRRGTALDRIYGYHIERGSIEALVKELQARTKKAAKDGTAWMLLALIESQRGRDAAAVTAFREAEKHRPEDPLASYYLGQALVLVGQPDEAAQAFERSIQRKPNRADLLDIFQALGRVYQRSQRNEQALEVWNRLEKLFPDDPRVQEQIATTLAEEGQHAEALPRYERLLKSTKDEYRKSLFRIETAELKIRLGQAQKALEDFEGLLTQLNPDSWLYREVRRKVEEVFLRNDDLAGLAKYYEGWIKKNPEDVEAMARLARALAQQGRGPESQSWLDKALKLAPSRKELRLAMIEQLVYEQKFPEAIAQYEALTKNDPNNPDYLREWGKLILKDKSKPEKERKQAAGTVWRRLIEAKPKDPVVHTQLADLFRQAEMVDEAVAHYKKAIELAPDAPQYYEYLGEYYHTLKRSDEALATWREIAKDKNRTAKNLARLSEVFAGFGYVKEALVAAAEAIELDKDDFNLIVKYADLLHQTEKYDDALKQLAVAEKLVTNAEESEAVLQQQIKNFQAKETLDDEIAGLHRELQQGKDATAKRYFLLARYLEAQRQLPEATQAVLKALELDNQSIPAWAAAARIHESSGNLLAAAEANRKLAAIDRRYRTEYLTNVAKLESRLGRKDQALQAGRDLLAAAPGNPDHYKFFAELCFQLGNADEGFDALRRSVRVNPSDPQVIMTLAQALAERFRTDEAIELYWRAFEKQADMEGKLGTVSRLGELYLQLNHFDRLVERIERERREPDKQREMSLCLAQAYHAAGDYGTARQELERLLTQNPRDTQLLTQLSSLSETEGDLASAVKYQQQLNQVAPSKEGELRLATLLSRSGEADEAGTIYVRLATSEQDPQKALQAVDSLLQTSKHETVLAVTERMLRDNPKNWEVLYREGVAFMSLEKPAEAARRFQAILDLRLGDDEAGVAAKARSKPAPGKQAKPARTSSSPLQTPQRFPLQDRLNHVWEVRRTTGLEPRYYYYGQQAHWFPVDFGMARMAAVAWQLNLAQKENKQDEFLKKLRDQAGGAAGPAADRSRLDWFYLVSVRQEQKEMYDAARSLAKGNDLTGHYIFLNSLQSRVYGGRGRRVVYQQTGSVDNTPPLPDDELKLVMECYRSLQSRRPEWLNQMVLQNVMTELKRAKRVEDEEKVYQDAVAAANQVDTVTSAIQLAAMRGDVDGLVKLYDKLDRLQGNKATAGSYGYYGYNSGAADALARAMSKRADDKAHGDVLQLLDRYLASRIREQKAAAAGRRSGAGQHYYRQHYHYQIWMGPTQRGINLDFPTPNEYYDHGAVQLLRQAFELYKRDDLMSDLFTHLRGRADKATDSEKVFAHLGLGYLQWWNGDKEPALKELTAASDVAATDLNLRLEVATLRERNGEPDEALALIETITPLDNKIMQQREQMALRLAVMTGNVDRARTAADRLFGLRLDADTQVQLAGKMRELGMHDIAEAVLARARRQAGNRASALVNLMLQYQNQNKLETAVQVAHQLLRRGPSRHSNPYGGGEDDYARQQAVQVLARSGRLQDLIDRAESQLKTSPRSMQLHQMLAEYYKAAGQRDKVKEMYQKMAELKPDDARLRYQVAQQLFQSGEGAAALEHYRAALKKEPSLFGHNYYEIRQAFEQANKLDELVKLFDDIDVRQMGHYYYVMDFVQNFLQNEKTREQGLKLFKKAWQAFPEQRAYLLGNIYHDDIWKLPEMYDFLRQAIIPTDQNLVDPWQGFDQITSWSGDGKINTVVGRLIEAAARQNKIEVLYKEAQQAAAKLPDWTGGKALIAILDVRRNKIDEAKKAVGDLMGDPKQPIPLTPRWILAQELENYGPMTDLAVKLHEGGVQDALTDQNTQFSYSPVLRLVQLYKKQGRNEEARAIVMKFAGAETNYPWDPHYAAYRKVENVSTAADQMVQLGYPADAVRLYNQLLGDASQLQVANQWYGGGDQFTQRAQQGLTRALQSVKPEIMGRTIRELIKPAEQTKSGARPDAVASIDLLLLVQPREMSRARLDSMLATTLKKAASTPELLAEVKSSLAELAKQRPHDVPLHVAATLTALNEGKAESVAEAVKQLEGVVEAAPLEPLPPGTRANSRQRTEASRQIGLWLVARECLRNEELRPAGDKLAARALEAARRQADNTYALALLREWGDMDLKRGDRKAAEERWTQMLETVMTTKPTPTPSPEKP